MAHEHGKAGGAHDHAEDGEPDVGHADGWVEAVADAEHVTHRLEQGVGVLLTPGVVLQGGSDSWIGWTNGACKFLKLQ